MRGPAGLQTVLLSVAGVLLAANVTLAQDARPPASSAESARPDPAETKLSWLPTARTLPRGQMSMTLFGPMPVFQIGITDRLSVGAGAMGFGADGPAVLLTPKWQVSRRERTRVAVGAYHLIAGDEAAGGLAYGVMTRGGDEAAVHAGLGWWYVWADRERGSTPMAMFGAERRLSPKLKVIVDASVLKYYWTANLTLRVVRGRGAADIGLAVVPFDESVMAFPTFMFVWRF
jgi:hypothetical protein